MKLCIYSLHCWILQPLEPLHLTKRSCYFRVTVMTVCLNDVRLWWQCVQMTCDRDDSVSKWRVIVMTVCQMTCDCDDIAYKWRVTVMILLTNDVWLCWQYVTNGVYNTMIKMEMVTNRDLFMNVRQKTTESKIKCETVQTKYCKYKTIISSQYYAKQKACLYALILYILIFKNLCANNYDMKYLYTIECV